jgi:membrane-bound serine protease (ClpP class)
VALLIAEVKLTSGILGAGGVVALALGSLILFDWSAPDYLRLSLAVVVPTVAVVAALLLLLVGAGVRAQAQPAMGGQEGLVGQVGTARTRLAPEGTAFVHGELWTARSATPIEAGERVRVTGLDGLVLVVEPADRRGAG